MSDPSSARPIILCPLEFERRALARADLSPQADIVCCGPGAEAVVRWAEGVGASSRRVILAGLAGALRETSRPGEAYVISTVVSHDGKQFRAEHDSRRAPADALSSRRAVVAASTEVLTSPAAKRALAEKSGADIVDQESGLFAHAATILGWRWAIVRGVSDALDDRLPPDIGRWVARDGSTRTATAAISLLRRPWFLPAVARVRGNAIRAMRAVALAVSDVLRADVTATPVRHAGALVE